MSKIPTLLGLHAKPPKWLKFSLGVLPFIILIAVYLTASHIRHKENQDDKLLPSISKMASSAKMMAFVKDKREDAYLMLQDTLASLKRIGIALGLAALTGLMLGVNLGIFPGLNAVFLPVIRFLAIIPPLALLPILFISFGVDELGKIMLIFWGSFFLITRNMHLVTEAIPQEQITKALTLGASSCQLVYRIILPQILPKLLETLRLSMGGAWLFLIAAEAISSTNGLGYRIFLVRRYLAMDIIIPYVIWITFLGFLIDWLLRVIMRRAFPWYVATELKG
ncbi:binding-protein-dependent transport system inner membrane protein [Candidatus Magnetoovum chiemensis]|nr:binding-protein-dependent transport system inner membrane protein [Candidatus Magnetoovum chiemensis]